MEYLYTSENGIAFRKVDISDVDDLTDLKNESWFGTHRVSLINKANQNNWLEALNQEDIHTPRNLVLIAAVPVHEILSARVDDSYTKIGVFKILGIDWQSRIGQVGWDIYKAYRGKGFGHNIVKAGVDFCFKVMNLHRVEADILTTNAVSHKCAMAAGFEKEGCKRKSVMRGGKWVDNIIYGMIAPDSQ